MNLSLTPQLGAIAGWKLELTAVRPGRPARRGKTYTFSSADYRGSVEATLVSGLGAGSTTVIVEDVSDVDFQTLSALARGAPLEARLFLFWLDAPRSSLGGDGLVAVLRVTALRRRPGTWRYELVVEGREWVYDRLTLPCPEVTGPGPAGAAAALAQALFVEVARPPLPVPGDEIWATDPSLRALEQLRQLEAAMVAKAARTPAPRAGLGMYLIRDGQLQLGPDRLAEPLRVTRLDADGGLLFLERKGAVREDETAVEADDGDPPHRDLFVATLRGRPDVKPGDIVELAAPERGALGEELGFALGPAPQVASGKDVTAYVQEVNHRLSREQGFLTTLRCVAASSDGVTLLERLWFDGKATDSATEAGSGESFVTRFLDRVRDAARTDRWPDVAQVRAIHLGSGGESPAQTERLWRGIEPDGGRPFAAAQTPFARVKKELAAAPYLTPFAHGSCGLVLPRYPGTRVVVVHRGGDPDDPVDIGALWTRGSAPGAAEAGDWWLILPVDLDGDQAPAPSVPDRDPAAEKTPASATNDLIDARGNRVLEVGTLTIRVGKDHLLPPGVRPDIADDPVTIEHAGGNARIVIAQDGSITIQSSKTVTIKGEQGIALETGGDVTLSVGGHVDVQKAT